MDFGTTEYARAHDGTNIAYRVCGDGPDLLIVPGWVSNVELVTENPLMVWFMEQLASFSRVITMDKRGTGASDRVPPEELPSLEERMDDVRAVLDAVGSTRAALFGYSEGGPMAIVYASTHPDRVSHLVLYGSFARMDVEDAYPSAAGVPLGEFESALLERWNQGFPPIEMWAPSLAMPETQAFIAWHNRLSASPAAALALHRMALDTDVTEVLPAVKVPTLVLHARGDRVLGVAHGRFLAEQIPGARYVELPSADHFPFAADGATIVEEIREFVTGVRHVPDPDRVLATVVFTDIVGSTERAAAEGDAAWTSLLDKHDAIARAVVDGHRGRLVKTTGDGVVMTFDGPARAVRAASELRNRVATIGLAVRAGLHCGEIELRGDDIGGIGVHIAARVSALAGAGEVLTTRTVKDLVAGSGLRFDDRGIHTLKGVPDDWQLYAVSG